MAVFVGSAIVIVYICFKVLLSPGSDVDDVAMNWIIAHKFFFVLRGILMT